MKDTVIMKIRVPAAFASLLEDLARLNGASSEEQLVELAICDLELEVSENRILAVKHGLRGNGCDRAQLHALAGLEREATE